MILGWQGHCSLNGQGQNNLVFVGVEGAGQTGGINVLQTSFFKQNGSKKYIVVMTVPSEHMHLGSQEM